MEARARVWSAVFEEVAAVAVGLVVARVVLQENSMEVLVLTSILMVTGPDEEVAAELETALTPEPAAPEKVSPMPFWTAFIF